MGNGQSSSITKQWQTETVSLPSPSMPHTPSPLPHSRKDPPTLSKDSDGTQDMALPPCIEIESSPAGLDYRIQFIEHLVISKSPPSFPPATTKSIQPTGIFLLDHSMASFLPPCLQLHFTLLLGKDFYHTQSLA